MWGSVYVPIKPVMRIWSPVSSRTSLITQYVNDSPKFNVPPGIPFVVVLPAQQQNVAGRIEQGYRSRWPN